MVEFQTPTYERFILSFTQKVLTQDYWDTVKAIELMEVQVVQKNTIERLAETEVYVCEQIGKFSDFEAQRFSFKNQGDIEVDETFNLQGVVVFVLQGTIRHSPRRPSSRGVFAGRVFFISARKSKDGWFLGIAVFTW